MEFYKPGQVAALLGINTRTVDRWARVGILHPVIYPTGRRMFPKPEIDAMVAEIEQQLERVS